MNANWRKAMRFLTLCVAFVATDVFAQDAMPDMDMPMQSGAAPAGARSADYSDGIGLGAMTGMDMRDDASLGMLLLDRLEVFDAHNANGVALDAQAWYGTDANKLWLKAEDESSGGRVQQLRSEALWDRPVAAYWDSQLGVRHDSGIGPNRTWAAFGVHGLAPYWFDIDATLYVGQSGRTALRFASEYELLLTQRLILQPRFEANFYGRNDPQRRIGSGLSNAALGLRLRYEFTRQFAPYVGLEAVRSFGRTADFACAAGDSAFDPRLVAGFRIWF
jgi:copper resistance protein B